MTQTRVPGSVDLSGEWQLSDRSGDHRCAAPVPGDGISALAAADLIPEPYWGRNEYDLRWIAERDWVFARRIDLERTDLALVLSGLDCVAEVRWNGALVLETCNAFRSYRVDLPEVARPGQNEIEITILSSVAAAKALQDAQPFYIPYSADNSPIPNGNMLRKPQCDFGWDWNIALAPFGILGDVRLEPLAAPRIQRLEIVQEHKDGSVSLGVTAHLEAAAGADYTIDFAGHSLAGQVDTGETRLTAWFDIENPALWWPAGQGPQTLHDLTVRVGAAEAHRRIGLRKIELITDADEAGHRFAFRVNGREIFIKGANWIPADALPGRITQDGVRDLLHSATASHMNMIRVWGGGRYEPGWFYDICDDLGLMVWQDFMFACNLYPSTDAFLEEVAAEVRETVERLHHHASLALWCGDNELIGALTWFPESVNDRDRYLVNYDRLNRRIEAELKATDPKALWWPSSPCPGPMNFGDSWHEDGSGDMHFWSVWHEGRDFEHYRDVAPRFCSEFGFQSYPSMQTIRRFAAPKDWNIASPVFESHQKNAGGNARIAETMFRYFRWPEKFEDFVWLSQIQQGLAIKTAVEHWRSLAPHCMGTLYWQLNDTWPVCSWSSLDHGGGWKMLHYMARRFYAPQIVVARPRDGGFEVVALNDAPGAAEMSVTLQAMTPDGTRRALAEGGGTIGAVPQVVALLDPGALTPEEMILLDWVGPDGTSGRDLFAPHPWKAYDLAPASIAFEQSQTETGWDIDLYVEGAPALFVTLEADQPGRFSDAALHLLPGESRRLTFMPEEPAERPQLLVRDLYSATMAQH